MYRYSDLKNSLKSLTEDNLFIINQIDISENYFGNVIIKLHSENLQIKFISDKNEFWCEIGYEDDLYFLEDIVSLLNFEISEFGNTFLIYIENSSNFIISKYDKLLNLFSSKNLSTTKEKLKKIGIERARKMFGIN